MHTDDNFTLTLDRAVEKLGPDKPALLTTEGTVTYGELLSACSRFADVLRRLGVRREERVLMVMEDSMRLVTAFLGCLRFGAVPVPVNTYYNEQQLAHFVADARPHVVIASPGCAGGLEQACAESGDCLLLLDDQLDAVLAAADDDVPAADTHPDDIGFMLYTSGSTGLPKGVVHLHHDAAVAARGFPAEVLGMTPDDVTFSTGKLSHAYGLSNNLLAPLAFGATAVIRPGRLDAAAILETLRETRPTLLFALPGHYVGLLAADGLAEAVAPLRLCVSAGEQLPAATFERWLDATGTPILDAIGSTELLQMYCANRPGCERPGSVGPPVPGCEVRIVDEHGGELGAGEIGELEVRSDHALAHYWRDHATTRRRCRGEWFATGDRARRDEDGYYRYEGRVDDMLKVGGLWVSPTEIEEELARHPEVREAAVVGVDTDERTQVCAYVVPATEPHALDHETLADELRRQCKERLQRHRYPRRIDFVDELPRAATSKVQRFELRRRAAQPPTEGDR